jgi:hypothetical protein
MIDTKRQAGQLAREIADRLATGGSHVNDSLDTVETLRSLIGELEDQIAGGIAVARAQGAEWHDIGRALGVSKQAAHKRYA